MPNDDGKVSLNRKDYEIWLQTDIALPAPDANILHPPEDSRPWTREDDSILRVECEKFAHLAPLPWRQIAMACDRAAKGKYGHNDGSCKKRFEEIGPLKTDKADVFCFQPGGAMTSFKKAPFQAA